MRIRTGLTAMLISALALLAPAAQASAASPPFLQAQVGLTYTVYEPANTFGMALGATGAPGFQLVPCGGSDEMISASYGGRVTPKRMVVGPRFTLSESVKGCLDGPDGVGRTASFTVRGATATVMGACAGGMSSCSSAPASGVRTSAYTTVTLPAGGPGLQPTFVEVLSTGLSLGQIKALVRSMQPVG